MAGKGFDGRVFLTDSEHETYMRRMPVRYIRKKKDAVCAVCGLPSSADKPFESAHLIPFGLGIRHFKLTPDFLDSEKNIVTAHRGMCNKKAELSIADITEKLKSFGLQACL